MSGFDDFFKTFGEAPQEASQERAPAEAAEEKPSAAKADAFADFEAAFGAAAPAAAPGVPAMPSMGTDAPQGLDPYSAIPESPLGIIDRARLGWAKTPAAQKQMLEEEFGKDNIQLIKGEHGAGFVVKQKDGRWYEVDPHFSWDLSGKGALAGALTGGAVAGPAGFLGGGIAGGVAPSFMDGGNLKDLPGDVAQYAGEYGLKTLAALKGGAAGATSLGAVGAMGGPIGAGLGAVVGGVAGAGLGAVGAEGAETLARMGGSVAGLGGDASIPKDNEELSQQLQASFLFGASQEAGGRLLGFGAKKSVDVLAGTLERLKSSPAGKALASKVLGTISGLGENLTRVRVENPLAMVPFDKMAAQDVKMGKDTLYQAMKGKVLQGYEALKGAQRRLGSQYDPIEARAMGLKFQPTEAVDGFMYGLKNSRFLTSSGKLVDASKPGAVERAIEPSEKKVLNMLMNQARTMHQRIAEGKHVTFQEIKNLKANLNNAIGNREKVLDPELRKLMIDFRNGLDDHWQGALEKVDPAKYQLLLELNKKWGPVKEMMEDLGSHADDGRVDAFLKRIIRQDGTFDSGLMSGLSELLGTANPTDDILRMHVARKSTNLWGGKKMFGVPVGSPALARGAATGFSTAKAGVTELATGVKKSLPEVPYLGMAHKWMRGLTPEQRKVMLSDPELLGQMERIIMGGVMGEKEAEGQLLNQAEQVLSGSGY